MSGSLPALAALLEVDRDATGVVAIRRGRMLSFAELRRDVAHNATHIAALRWRRGLLICADAYWFAVGLLAMLGAGCDVLLPPNGLPATLSSLAPLAEGVVSDAAPTEAGAALVLSPGERETPPLRQGEARLALCTSGSTGEAKLVWKRPRQLESEIANLEHCFGDRLGDAQVLSLVSPQHIYGLLFQVLWPLSAGRPFGAELHARWEPLLEEAGPRFAVVASPAHLTRLPPGSLRRRPVAVFCSGGPLGFEAATAAATLFGTPPIEVFGSTETGGVGYRSQTDAAIPWQRFPGIELATDDDDVLQLRSPYLEAAGWYAMSDRARLLDAGRFLLSGRADRIVKVEGKRVALPEVERRLTELAWVEAAAVELLPGKPPVLVAAVVPSAAGRAALAAQGEFRFSRALRRALKDQAEAAAMPRRWRFLDEIPTNAQGKRLAGAILRLFA